ncbi:MAG: carboxypeptidase regulatory-like domain-containing protein [Dolichospermum sp. DEX182a]|nr:carboxypeptidase regulatory-like domain-containing protein [Dolichospermum sp. DEX182a]
MLVFQPSFETAAIEVIPGTYTPVIAEFIPSYTVSGVVKDNQGNPVGGAKIEAITTGKPPVSSITNEGGVYYLERLQRGNYKLSISGEKSAPDHIIVDEKSPAFKELNLILK